MTTQRFRLGLAAAGLCLLVMAVRCDYSAPRTNVPTTSGTYEKGFNPYSGTAGPGGLSSSTSTVPAGDKGVILENVLELIRTAALKPGGDNFAIATKNLNQYFNDVKPAEFALKPEARSFLLQHVPTFRPDQTTEEVVKNLESPAFGMPDARHMEDCMLYHTVAMRVGGTGDDLTRVRRVFRWIMEQISLVPAGSLGPFARPYDVLMRGMATEADGFWAERAWLFMVLCRQMGVDVGLLTYTPAGAKEPVIWTCAPLIDGKLYLFDARIGLEVPGPDGNGVATLDDALRDPSVLARLDLPGQSPYGTTRDSLLGSASKIGVQIDSSPDYRSPRMELLQRSLAGKNRTLLYRDPVAERDRFVAALGEHSGGVSFWALPAQVEYLLFHDNRFVQATQVALMLFDPNLYPLVYARIRQLQGELTQAKEEYVHFRFAERPMLLNKRAPIPPEIQQALDVYATYFLALCHLEQGHPDLAKDFFEATLRLLPEPGRGQPYYNMFRWGAEANLGRLHEAKGDDALAIAYYSEDDPTPQRHGNLVRARELVWRNPTAPPPPPLPPAPQSSTAPPPMIAAPPRQ